MSEPILSYERVTENKRRFMWVAAALEMEGGVILMPSVLWLVLGLLVTLNVPPRSAGGWALAVLELLAPAAVGLGLVVSGLWLRGREPQAPIVGALLISLVAAPFGWLAATMLLHVRFHAWVFLASALAVSCAVIVFQAILLVGLVHHHVRNQQDRRERLSLIT